MFKLISDAAAHKGPVVSVKLLSKRKAHKSLAANVISKTNTS